MKLLPSFEHMDPPKRASFRRSPELKKRWPWWRIVLWIVVLVLVVVIMMVLGEYSRAENELLLPWLVALG